MVMEAKPHVAFGGKKINRVVAVTSSRRVTCCKGMDCSARDGLDGGVLEKAASPSMLQVQAVLSRDQGVPKTLAEWTPFAAATPCLIPPEWIWMDPCDTCTKKQRFGNQKTRVLVVGE